MLDVLHFLFEEDFTSPSEEHARSRSSLRDTIFNDLYGVRYSFRLSDAKNAPRSASNEFDYSEYENSLDSVEPVNPRRDDAFTPAPGKTKAKFVDADSVPLVPQSFEGLDAPLN